MSQTSQNLEISDTESGFSGANSVKTRQTFTSFETELLLSLVNSGKKVLEDKRTDFLNSDKKRKAWDSLVQQFNSSAEVKKRTRAQLQKKWDNMKRRAKKDVRSNLISNCFDFQDLHLILPYYSLGNYSQEET